MPSKGFRSHVSTNGRTKVRPAGNQGELDLKSLCRGTGETSRAAPMARAQSHRWCTGCDSRYCGICVPFEPPAPSGPDGVETDADHLRFRVDDGSGDFGG